MSTTTARKKKAAGARAKPVVAQGQTTVAQHLQDVAAGRAKPQTLAERCPGPQAVVPIPIDDLIVDADHRRSLDFQRVAALESSIEASGLLQPICVRREPPQKGEPPTWRLIAGAHRVEAYVNLGRSHIPAIVLEVDDLHAVLAEIDENLVRSPLTTLEEAQAIARRKEIYESLHPETRRGAKGGRRGKELDLTVRSNSDAEPPITTSFPSFVEDTAAKTGKSTQTISRQAKLGREIPADVAAKVRKLPKIADSPKELAKLARLSPDDQRSVVDSLLARDPRPDGKPCETVSDALAEHPGIGEPTPKTSPAKARVPDVAPKAAAGDGGTWLEQTKLPEDGPAGAGQWLRGELGALIGRYQARWGEDATSILAAAVLEGYAAELRDTFVALCRPTTEPRVRGVR